MFLLNKVKLFNYDQLDARKLHFYYSAFANLLLFIWIISASVNKLKLWNLHFICKSCDIYFSIKAGLNFIYLVFYAAILQNLFFTSFPEKPWTLHHRFFYFYSFIEGTFLMSIISALFPFVLIEKLITLLV